MTEHAQPQPGSVWVEEVIHATCANCGQSLKRRPSISGIIGGITWYHPHTVHHRHNGAECE